jgi:predicted O-methyltransferase YrrM
MDFGTATLLELRDNVLGRRYKERSGRPFMKYREVMIFEEIHVALRPRRVLEWGAGSSTLYFPARMPFLERWLAVEHDEAWAKRVADGNRDPRVEVRFVRPNRTPWTDPEGDGAVDDLLDYLAAPATEAPFDLVVIDGRARRVCLERAYDLVTPEGAVILHDANREHYLVPANRYPHRVLLQDYRRSAGGLLVASRETDPAAWFDVDAHRRAWKRIDNRLGKILSL